MKNILYFNLTIFSFLFFLAVILICNLSFLPLFYWIIVFLSVTFISRKLFHQEVNDYAVLSYPIFTIFGTIALFSYVKTYGYTFSPYWDDSYFFNAAMNYARGIGNEKTEIYSIFLALFVYPFRFVADSFPHAALLPLNWGAASIVVGYTLQIPSDIFFENKKNIPISSLAFISIALNCIFSDTVIHLYRDVFVLLFALISFHYAYRHQWFRCFIFLLLCGLLRTANALMGGFLCFFIWVSTYFKVINRKSFIALFVVMFLTIYLLGNHVSFNPTSFSQTTNTEVNVFQMLEHRAVGFVEHERDSDQLKKKGILGNIAYCVYFMFAPLNITAWTVPIEKASINLQGEEEQIEKIQIFRIDYFIAFLSIAAMVFIIPKILLFVFAGLQDADIKIFLFTSIFILYILLIVYVSMQPRHKTFFIIFYPIIIILYDSLYRLKYLKWERMFRILTATLLVSINLWGLLHKLL